MSSDYFLLNRTVQFQCLLHQLNQTKPNLNIRDSPNPIPTQTEINLILSQPTHLTQSLTLWPNIQLLNLSMQSNLLDYLYI